MFRCIVGPDRELRYDLFTAEGGEWAMGVSVAILRISQRSDD